MIVGVASQSPGLWRLRRCVCMTGNFVTRVHEKNSHFMMLGSVSRAFVSQESNRENSLLG